MKLYNFLFFLLNLCVATVCASNVNFTELADVARSNRLYEEMSSTPSFVNRLNGMGSSHNSLTLPHSYYSNDSASVWHNSYNSYRLYDSQASDLIDYNRYEVINVHEQPLIYATSSNIQISDDRNQMNEYQNLKKLSVKTRVAFAAVAAFSLIEFGFDVVNLHNYYTNPQCSDARPGFLIARLADSSLRNIALYALYKFNKDRL